MTVKVSAKRSLADRLWLLVMVVARRRCWRLTVKLPYVPVASPVKLSTASWSTSLALTVPAAVKGPSSAVAPLWSRRRDHRRVIGAGDRDGDVLAVVASDRPSR